MFRLLFYLRRKTDSVSTYRYQPTDGFTVNIFDISAKSGLSQLVSTLIGKADLLLVEHLYHGLMFDRYMRCPFDQHDSHTCGILFEFSVPDILLDLKSLLMKVNPFQAAINCLNISAHELVDILWIGMHILRGTYLSYRQIWISTWIVIHYLNFMRLRLLIIPRFEISTYEGNLLYGLLMLRNDWNSFNWMILTKRMEFLIFVFQSFF